MIETLCKSSNECTNVRLGVLLFGIDIVNGINQNISIFGPSQVFHEISLLIDS